MPEGWGFRGESSPSCSLLLFFFQAEDGIRDDLVTGVQTCALPILAISERDARFLSGDKSLDPSEPQDKLRGGYTVCKTKPELLLHEGDRVGSLEVIATPGHTPGHIAFLDTRDRAVIVGDAFQTLGGVAISGTIKPLFPLPALAT